MNARTNHSVLLDPSAEAALSTRGDKPNSSSSIRTRRNGALDPRGAKKALCNRGLERKRARSVPPRMKCQDKGFRRLARGGSFVTPESPREQPLKSPCPRAAFGVTHARFSAGDGPIATPLQTVGWLLGHDCGNELLEASSETRP